MVALPLKKDGIYSALFTPVKADGSLDSLRLRELVRYEVQHGAEGFYCCGSSGEALLLERQERMELVDVVASEVGGKLPFVVHTGSLSTRDAVLLSQHAQKAGASAVSLIPPIYYNYKQEEVTGYYKDVIAAVDLGVIVYNIPQFTGISFSKNNSLLSDERIIGIKHTSMNLFELERIVDAFPGKTIFNGFDEIWLYSLAAGASATIGTTVNICPKLYRAIRNAYDAADLEKAKSLQSVANEFIETLVSINVFPAAKHCMGILGVDIGPCRKPFSPLKEEDKQILTAAVDRIADYL